MTDMLERWRDPIFNNPYQHIPARLAARLTELAAQTTASEDVAQALADGRIPRSTGAVPVFPQRFTDLPTSLLLYNEQLQALVALAAEATTTDANYEPPADTKSPIGFTLGEALGSGCALADVATAAGLTPGQIIALAKRTIPAGASSLKQL
jgi:hypothetical protein